MRVQTVVLAAVAAAVGFVGTASQASAQGCILIRQTSPMFGTTGSIDQDVGTWNITISGRNSTADIHYNGTERQIQRETERTYVVNRQNSVTATIGYQLSPRISLNAGVPFVEASWGIPSPRAGGPGMRANENARGLGDITTLARVSLLSPIRTRLQFQLQRLGVGSGMLLGVGS